MPTQKLTAEIIHAAIEGFESQKRRIDSQIGELRELLRTDHTEAAPASGAPAPKRKVSAAGRRRMAAAQQARWAKVRGQSELPSAPSLKPAKQKRKLSEAGRKAISEATKKRWALKKAEAQKAPATVAKKSAVKSPAKAAKKTAAGKRSQKRGSEAAVTPAAQ
jgi:hypothetical protein